MTSTEIYYAEIDFLDPVPIPRFAQAISDALSLGDVAPSEDASLLGDNPHKIDERGRMYLRWGNHEHSNLLFPFEFISIEYCIEKPEEDPYIALDVDPRYAKIWRELDLKEDPIYFGGLVYPMWATVGMTSTADVICAVAQALEDVCPEGRRVRTYVCRHMDKLHMDRDMGFWVRGFGAPEGNATAGRAFAAKAARMRKQAS